MHQEWSLGKVRRKIKRRKSNQEGRKKKLWTKFLATHVIEQTKCHLSFLLKISSILVKILIIAGEPTKEKEDKNKCNHNTWIRWRTYRRKDNECREKEYVK